MSVVLITDVSGSPGERLRVSSRREAGAHILSGLRA